MYAIEVDSNTSKPTMYFFMYALIFIMNLKIN